MTRKEFLKLLAMGSGLSLLPRWAMGETKMMAKRAIPSSGEMLGVVGIGTWQVFDIGQDEAERRLRREVLGLLFESGGSVIDSSPMYGRAEAVVGDLLADMKAQSRAFVATKVWTEGERAGVAQMAQSAKLLRKPVIDLMQIHNLVDWRTHIKTLRAKKERGAIRYIGLTHYTDSSLDHLADIITSEPVDFIQLAYSLETQKAAERLLPLAQDKGVAVLVNRPFGGGGLFGKIRNVAPAPWLAEFDCASWAQFFLKFILAHGGVTCVIPGTGRPDHAADNFAAGMGRMPEQQEQQPMLAYWNNL